MYSQTIYLIDDDITSLNFMGLVLRKFDKSFEKFVDPAAAIARVGVDRPQIVITDLVMPKMDGFAVMEQVRSASPGTAVVLLTGQSEIDSAIEAIRRGACDYVTKPVNPDRLLSAIHVAEQSHQKAIADPDGNGYTVELATMQAQLRQLNDTAKCALISALDARERETKQHSVRVSLYAAHLAQQMGLAFGRIESIRAGALLHDIGKIGIPDSILNKPAALDSEEWKIMRRHPEIGFAIVRGLIGETEGAHIVLCHHERFDGGGYPKGLKGSQIPLGARLFAVVDAYDALTSARPYREPVSHWEATREILECSHSHFDPEVVAAFLQVPEYRWTEHARCAEEIVLSTDEENIAAGVPADLARAAGLSV